MDAVGPSRWRAVGQLVDVSISNGEDGVAGARIAAGRQPANGIGGYCVARPLQIVCRGVDPRSLTPRLMIAVRACRRQAGFARNAAA
jgi:hypothetical protein